MDATPSNTPAPGLEATARAIKDLSLLLLALLTSLPTSKPWQRQLRAHLAQADGLLQVLRMTVSMERGGPEIVQAVRDLMVPLRAANAYVAAVRADAGTKQAVHLGFNLAQKTLTGLESSPMAMLAPPKSGEVSVD